MNKLSSFLLGSFLFIVLSVFLLIAGACGYRDPYFLEITKIGNAVGKRATAAQYFVDGLEFYRDKKFQPAAEQFFRAAKADPSWWQPYFKLAEVRAQQKHFSFTSKYLELALARDRDGVVPALIKGKLDLMNYRATSQYGTIQHLVVRAENLNYALKVLKRLRQSYTRFELQNLESLDLSATGVTDSDLKFLTAVPNLKSVSLALTRITPVGIKHLSKLRALTHLTIAGTRNGDQAIVELASLENLIFLDLSRTGISDSSCKALGKLMKLEILALHGTRISDVCLIALTPLDDLRSLDISETLISDKGVRLLSQETAIAILDISRTSVTAKSLDYLSQNSAFKSVDVSGTKVTAADIQAFQARTHPSRWKLSIKNH